MVGITAFPSFGYYSATKFALEGLSEALAAEVAPLGIQTTLVEPGAFNTGYSSRALVYGENRLPDVYPSTEQMIGGFSHADSQAVGDPVKAVRVIIAAVDSDNPPFRLPIGADAYETIEAKLERVKQEIAVWRDRAIKTAFDAAVTA